MEHTANTAGIPLSEIRVGDTVKIVVTPSKGLSWAKPFTIAGEVTRSPHSGSLYVGIHWLGAGGTEIISYTRKDPEWHDWMLVIYKGHVYSRSGSGLAHWHTTTRVCGCGDDWVNAPEHLRHDSEDIDPGEVYRARVITY